MRGTRLALLALATAVAAAAWDLTLAERSTVVVYTTPALRDLLEKDVIPVFRERTGHEVALIYVPAGQQFNRLRMSGDRPEADLFLHASPLYIEKAFATGHVDLQRIHGTEALEPRYASRTVEGGSIWTAFAWSPLVEVFGPGIAAAPDLGTFDAAFGFPHPVLSNNGIYAVLLFEAVAPSAGRLALANTRVQPVNARANIAGIADGSFQLTLGYEAVVRFFQSQGARVSYELPVIAGEQVTTPALFSIGLIRGDRHPGADELAAFLFTEEAQSLLGRHHLRGVLPGLPTAEGLLDLDGARVRRIDHDWSGWSELESVLPQYEVK